MPNHAPVFNGLLSPRLSCSWKGEAGPEGRGCTAAEECLAEYSLASLPGPSNIYSYFNSHEGQLISMCQHTTETTFPTLFSSVLGTLLGSLKKGIPQGSTEALSKQQAPSGLPRNMELGGFADSSHREVPPILPSLLLVLRTRWKM